jgi:hypothetical protein
MRALVEVDDRPEFVGGHPWGCHRRRIPDRVVFDHVLAALVHGSGYERIATPGCSDRTIRRRVAEWAERIVGVELLKAALAAYDQMIGLDLEDLSLDGSITKSLCGGNFRVDPRSIAASKAPNARWSPTGAASPLPSSPPAPTGTTHPVRTQPCAAGDVVGDEGGEQLHAAADEATAVGVHNRRARWSSRRAEPLQADLGAVRRPGGVAAARDLRVRGQRRADHRVPRLDLLAEHAMVGYRGRCRHAGVLL